MTDDTTRRRLTISVPPDVAARLEQEPNASAYVTRTVRARMAADARAAAVRAELAAAGMVTTERGMADARARRYAAHAELPAGWAAAARAEARAGVLGDIAGADPSAHRPAA